ncbi:MAG TPA: hypothetical protein VFF00_04235 [Candidatus Elarobacter sp.]|nr:hypothetical protein [Candidatus Elarobacter sp.]
MNLRQIALAVLAAAALGGAAVAQAGPVGQAAPATPPPPPPPNANAAPTPGTLIGTPVPATPRALASPSAAPSATPAPGRRGRRGSTPAPEASASETPEPPQFSTMDGVWEVQLQPLMTGKTIYSHLVITQKGDALSGTWIRSDKDKAAFTGTFDGRLFKLTATGTDAAKTVWTLSGYAENFSDMVGLVTTPDPKATGTPFTATHRKKERIGI